MEHMAKIEWRLYCTERHDVFCNQKYDFTYPYSYHLELVLNQYAKFKHLLRGQEVDLAYMGVWGHDLIEDARLTYNDVKDKTSTEVAEIIYLCTEEKGRDRAARHSDKYYCEMATNDIAIFVKLCDVMANVTHSLITDSTMHSKYKKEFPRLKRLLYRNRFEEMFDRLEKLVNL